MRPLTAAPPHAHAQSRVATVGPVEWFAAMVGTDLGGAASVEPWQLAEPYGTLLVHDGSMTARLERFFATRTTLELVSVVTQADRYARLIRLLDRDGRCLELGGTLLDLSRFTPPLRRDIVRGEEPLGRLLSRHGLAYGSLPRAFFVLDATAAVRGHLQMEGIQPVFGRRTDLVSDGIKLGDVLEVLPCYDAQRWPVPTSHSAAW